MIAPLFAQCQNVSCKWFDPIFMSTHDQQMHSFPKSGPNLAFQLNYPFRPFFNPWNQGPSLVEVWFDLYCRIVGPLVVEVCFQVTISHYLILEPYLPTTIEFYHSHRYDPIMIEPPFWLFRVPGETVPLCSHSGSHHHNPTIIQDPSL